MRTNFLHNFKSPIIYVVFFLSCSMGLAGVRNRDNMALFEAKRPLVVVYFAVDYTHNAKGSNYYRNRVIKVAKDFIGEVTFAISSKIEMASELEALGHGPALDIAAGLYDEKGQKYSMTESFRLAPAIKVRSPRHLMNALLFSVDNLRSFVQQFQAGELETYIKSEPIPEDNDGPVTVGLSNV